MLVEHTLVTGLVALNDSVLLSGLQGAASADDAMGAVRISLRRWLLRS